MRNGQPVIGHIWTGGEPCNGGQVWAVYNDPRYGPCYDRFVKGSGWHQQHAQGWQPGQDWRVLNEWTPAAHGDDRKAYHEAGHAVIGRLRGLRVEYVTIAAHDRPDGRPEGYCQLDYQLRLVDATPDQLINLAMYMMGGMVAELRYVEDLRLLQTDIKNLDPRTWDGDTPKIGQYLKLLSLEGMPTDRDGLEERVCELVHEGGNWGWITRIACRLATDGAIPGRVVDELRAEPI